MWTAHKILLRNTNKKSSKESYLKHSQDPPQDWWAPSPAPPPECKTPSSFTSSSHSNWTTLRCLQLTHTSASHFFFVFFFWPDETQWNKNYEWRFFYVIYVVFIFFFSYSLHFSCRFFCAAFLFSSLLLHLLLRRRRLFVIFMVFASFANSSSVFPTLITNKLKLPRCVLQSILSRAVLILFSRNLNKNEKNEEQMKEDKNLGSEVSRGIQFHLGKINGSNWMFN